MPLFGLSTTNQIYTFDSATPTQGTGGAIITGLNVNERIIGIDMRPATGDVYGLSDQGRVYVINTVTGAVMGGVTLAADPTDTTSPFTALSGLAFGVDFNPVPDRLRVTSNTGQNLRINVANGLVTTDGNLNPGTPSIVASAYTNNDVDPGTGTTLYDIDDITDTLYIREPAERRHARGGGHRTRRRCQRRDRIGDRWRGHGVRGVHERTDRQEFALLDQPCGWNGVADRALRYRRQHCECHRCSISLDRRCPSPRRACSCWVGSSRSPCDGDSHLAYI